MECTLAPNERVIRGERWLALGKADVEETPSGLRLGFPEAAATELRELARLERGCCAFASWDVSEEGDGAILDITTDGDAVAAAQSLFPSLRK